MCNRHIWSFAKPGSESIPVAEISVGWGGNCPPTSRRIVNLSEIFILSEVRKYKSYSDKTVIISKFPTN